MEGCFPAGGQRDRYHGWDLLHGSHRNCRRTETIDLLSDYSCTRACWLGVRAYDHGAYSAAYAFATAAGIALALVLAGIGTAQSSLIAGATLIALPHKACPIFWPPTDGGFFVILYIAAMAALIVVSLLLRYVLKAGAEMNLYRISALSALVAYLGVIPL